MENLKNREIPKKEIRNEDCPKLEIIVKKTQILANIFICLQIVLIGIALFQYFEAKKFNKNQIEISTKSESTKNAIEAINKIYNSEFLNSFAKLDKNSVLNDKTRNDFIIILNNYYIVAVVYNSGIADTNLIGESIKNGIIAFTNYPIYKSSIDKNIESAKVAIDTMIKSINNNKNEL